MARKGTKLSEAHRAKISAAHSGGRPKGSTLTEEHKENIRKALTGQPRGPMSDEQKAKIRAAIIGRSATWNLGRVPPNKGKPHSLESRAKMSLARKGHSGPNKGKTFSVEYRAKLSEAHMGQVAWNKGTKGVMKAWNKGKPATWVQGDKNPRWKGGITSQNRLLRASIMYREWRIAVLQRDWYTCRSCGKVGGRLQADHILIWSKHPELRFDVSNGQTLCGPCHRTKTAEDLKDNVNQYTKRTTDVNCTVFYR